MTWISQPTLEMNSVHVLDVNQRMNRLPHGSVDLFFTDPPYNIGVKYGVESDRMPPGLYFKQFLNAVGMNVTTDILTGMAVRQVYNPVLDILLEPIRRWLGHV